MNDYRNYLMHHGILGQKWGVRRYQNSDGSLTSAGKVRYAPSPRKAERHAKKDAKEYARAKMFYGEGAGTRRKLIKAKVEERSKNSNYKKAFEDNLSKQDMAKHSDAARHERARKDVKNSVKKTGRGVFHTVMGHRGVQTTAAAAAIGTGLLLAHKYGLDKKAVQWGATKMKDAKPVYEKVKSYRKR